MATALPFVEAIKSPVLAELKAQPEKYRQGKSISPESAVVIAAISEQMHQQVLQALPEAVRDNVIYGPFLSGPANEWIETNPALAANVPVKRHDHLVQGLIGNTALNIGGTLTRDKTIGIEDLATAIHNMQVTINQTLRQNLETLDASNIIYISPEKKCSPRALRKAVGEVQKAIKKGILTNDEASVALFWSLGAYSEKEIRKGGLKNRGLQVGKWTASLFREPPVRSFEDLARYDLTDLEKQIHESVIWARDFIDGKITKRINPLIHEAAESGKLKGVVTFPSLNQTLRGEDLFKFLQTMYSKESDVDDANDAQILANYSLVHWIFNRRRTELKHLHQIDGIDDEIEQEMFEMEADPEPSKELASPSDARLPSKILDLIMRLAKNLDITKAPRRKNRFVSDQTKKILKYDEEKKKFEETEALYDARCRVLKVSEEFTDIPEEKRLVYLDRMGQKTIESSVIKHFNPGRTNRDPDQMPDEVRTRLIAWNVTSKELVENSRLGQMYIESLEAMGRKLGLNPCKVEDELKHEHFPKMTLSGKNEQGINVEILLIPIDTHQFADPSSSWFNHDRLEEMRDIETLLVAIPYSASPVSHHEGNRRLKDIKQKRNDCRAARRAYLAKQAA